MAAWEKIRGNNKIFKIQTDEEEGGQVMAPFSPLLPLATSC